MALAVAAALVVGSRPDAPETVGQRVQQLASGIRCPSCSGLSAADSDASTAVAIRSTIRQRIEAGQSASAIQGYLVSRYGASILLKPPLSGVDALVWVLPAAGVGLAVAAGALMFWRRRRPRRAQLTEEDRQLVERALLEQARAQQGPTKGAATPGVR